MTSILQIGSDWPFVAHFAAQSEAVRDGASRYAVIVPPGTSPRHTAQLPSLLLIERSVAGLRALVREVNRSAGVLVHGMEPFAAAAIALSSGSARVMWSGWGYDYYTARSSERASLFEPLTWSYVRTLGREASLRTPRRWVTGPGERTLRLRAARRCQYFSAPVPQDLKVFRSTYPPFRGEYLQVNYGTIEDQYRVSAPTAPRTDILLGNSADPTNNHLDVIEMMSRTDLGPARVVAPLTYGSRSYAEVVAARGTELLGAAFVPVMHHMPLNDYNRLIARCGVIVMAHRRQQGLGNIITAVVSGARVLMSSQSPAYAFLTELGIGVGDWRNFASGVVSDHSPQTREEDTTRLAAMWGRDRVLKRTAVALDTLQGTLR